MLGFARRAARTDGAQTANSWVAGARARARATRAPCAAAPRIAGTTKPFVPSIISCGQLRHCSMLGPPPPTHRRAAHGGCAAPPAVVPQQAELPTCHRAPPQSSRPAGRKPAADAGGPQLEIVGRTTGGGVGGVGGNGSGPDAPPPLAGSLMGSSLLRGGSLPGSQSGTPSRAHKCVVSPTTPRHPRLAAARCCQAAPHRSRLRSCTGPPARCQRSPPTHDPPAHLRRRARTPLDAGRRPTSTPPRCRSCRSCPRPAAPIPRRPARRAAAGASCR